MSKFGKNLYVCFPTDAPKNPCEPSPCGPNSICKISNDQPICTCQPNYLGSPPNCRPECLISSECSQQQTCINQKCKNPCDGVCGINTDCKVINHSPICTCKLQHTGDPFSRCYKGIITFLHHK